MSDLNKEISQAIIFSWTNHSQCIPHDSCTLTDIDQTLHSLRFLSSSLHSVFSSPSIFNFCVLPIFSSIFWPCHSITFFSFPLTVLYPLAFLWSFITMPNLLAVQPVAISKPWFPNPSLLCSTLFPILPYFPTIPLHLALCSQSLSHAVRHSSSSLSSSETGNLLILTDGVLMEHPEELYRMQVSPHVLHSEPECTWPDFIIFWIIYCWISSPVPRRPAWTLLTLLLLRWSTQALVAFEVSWTPPGL